MGEVGVLNGLRNSIRNGNFFARWSFCIVLLVASVSCRTTSDFAQTLKNGTQVEQMEALVELSETGTKDDETRQLLIAAAQGALSPLVRSSAVRLMGRESRQEAYFPVFLYALEDPSFVVRFEAAHALGKAGRPEAVEPLILRLNKDEHAWVRFKAARSLARLGDRRALSGLVLALDDADETVRVNAFLALKSLTGEDHGRDADGWRALTD
jgi:HEAT repeat protein